MIDKGEIIASGTHQQLMKKSKQYHKLYQKDEINLK